MRQDCALTDRAQNFVPAPGVPAPGVPANGGRSLRTYFRGEDFFALCGAFGSDPRLNLPEWIKHPKWKMARAPLGALLVLFGFLGFLPVLGFWMIPLGFAILAIDFPAAERVNIWLKRKARRILARYRKFRARLRAQRAGKPIR